MFQNLQPRLSAVSGTSQKVIKFRRFSNICGDFSYVFCEHAQKRLFSSFR